MNYILDTNIIIYFLNGKHPKIAEHLRHVPAERIFISSITVAELEYGARGSRNYDETRQKIDRFLNAFTVLPFDEKAATFYGELRQQLKKNGTPIGANDMLIAGSALAKDAILITRNVKEFERVRGLTVEDWTE